MRDPEERKAEVRRFYDALLAGRSGSEVLGYATDWSQRVRFEALLAIGDLEGRSLLDVGCGRGDLLGHLRARGWSGEYTGVDIHPGMVELARRTWPGGRFEVRDILAEGGEDEADYVLSSGLFSVPANGDEEFIRAMLRAMMSLARRGVAVNFLSALSPNPLDPRSHYADPVRTLSLAFGLTRNVVLRHDYKGNDFTLYLRAFPAGAEEPR